jgi:hypothetical protein
MPIENLPVGKLAVIAVVQISFKGSFWGTPYMSDTINIMN